MKVLIFNNIILLALLLVVAVTSTARPLEEDDARNLQNENGTTTTTSVPHQETFVPTSFPFDCGWQLRHGSEDTPSNLVGGRYVDISSDGLTLAVGGISKTSSDNNDSGFIQLFQYEEGKTVENQYVGPTWHNVTKISFDSGPSFRMDLSNDGKKLVVLHTNSGQLDLYEYRPPLSSTMNNGTTFGGNWEKKELSQQLILSSEPSSVSFVVASGTSPAATSSSSNMSNEDHISDTTTTTTSNGESSGYYLAVGLVQEGKVELYEYSNDRFSLRDELSGGLYQNGEMVEGCFGHSVAQSRDGKVLAIGCPTSLEDMPVQGSVVVHRALFQEEQDDDHGGSTGVSTTFLSGDVPEGRFGDALSVSPSGNCIAVAGLSIVQVFEWVKDDNDDFYQLQQLGPDIYATMTGGRGNLSISVTDSHFLAIGTPNDDRSCFRCYHRGSVNVYGFNGSSWNRVGWTHSSYDDGDRSLFAGTENEEHFGTSVELIEEVEGFGLLLSMGSDDESVRVSQLDPDPCTEPGYFGPIAATPPPSIFQEKYDDDDDASGIYHRTSIGILLPLLVVLLL